MEKENKQLDRRSWVTGQKARDREEEEDHEVAGGMVVRETGGVGREGGGRDEWGRGTGEVGQGECAGLPVTGRVWTAADSPISSM